MGVRVSLDTVMRLTKSSVLLAHSWPPSRIDTKWQRIKLEIMLFASILMSVGLLVPLLVSIYEYRSNSLALTQSACFVGAIFNYIIKIIVYRIQRDRTQILINEMEGFLKIARPHENIVLHRYVDKISRFHAIITFVNYITAIGVICGPLFLPQKFPTGAVYPFSLESRFIKYLVYIHQSFVGLQCSTGATIDCQTAIMMWFAAARLEMLSNELESVSDVDGFRCFVKKHQRLLWYANEASQTMCYIAFTTSLMCGVGTIFSALQLMSNQPLAIKMQFGPVVMVAAMNLFVCSWPADNLMKVCHMMGTAVYNAPWTSMSSRAMKNYLFILHRSQTPVTISIGGFLPTLSLRSYAKFLSTAFSYTTTLRLIINADSKN